MPWRNPTAKDLARLGLTDQVTRAKLQPASARVKGSAPAHVRGPQAVLGAWLHDRWPDVWQENYRPLPDRKFELDFADPVHKLGIEVDGWQYHGKHKRGFDRDREKDRLITIAGWRVLRYTAGEIHRQVDLVLTQIKLAREG